MVCANDKTHGDGNVNFPEGWVPPEEKPPGDEDEEAVEDSPAEEEPEDDGLDDEQREELFVQAMKDAFGPHCGACIVDGSWFGDLEQEEMSDEVKAARSLQNLLTKAQRIPDLTIILKCKNDFAAKNSFDFDAIDRDYEERLAAYKAEVAAAEAKEEDPPEPPEGLVVDEESEEKESDRVKAKFIETKKSQQDALQEFAEALKAARAPLQKVSSDRGDAPTHKAIRWHCRPFVEKRQSLLLRQQVTKVSPSKAKDLLERGLVRVSKFGASSPLLEDSPSIRPPGADLHPAVLRNRMFYPASADELSKFLESPADYLTESGPSRAIAVPAIAVLGAPLSGKTTLARALSKRTGAVCISVASVLGELIAPAALPCKLSKDLPDISKSLRSGKEVPTDLVIAALKQRLVSADCLRSGWILDDFPCTVAQAEALTHAGIVPHRVLMLSATEEVIFSRTLALNAAAGEDGGALLQQELALQKERLSSFHSSAPALRVFYALIFENLRDIDGARSSWAVFDQALKETAKGELKAPKGRPGKNQQRARIPRKLPAEAAPDRPPAQLFSALVKGKDGRGLQPSDMVSYMQASLAEVICQGLVDAGEKRPLYPGKSPGESVLVYLARFLRARNPLGTELYAESASQSREDFLSTCSLPSVVLLGPTASAASSSSMPAAAALANEESADVLERQDGRNAKSRKTSKRSGEEVVVTLPGGELHYYPRTKQLCATCRCPAHLDGDCRRWRTMRKGPRADGRPVGLLVAWIQSTSKYKSRTEHFLAGSLHVLNRQHCHEAREYFRTLSGSDLILNEEAPVSE
eukprot:s2240_g1.t1